FKMVDADLLQERHAFWKTLWLPLLAFGVITSMDIINYIHLRLIFFIPLTFALLRVFASEDTQTRFMDATWFGWAVIGIPNMCRNYFSYMLPERGTASMIAYEEILINAALTFILLINCVLPSRRRSGTEIVLMSSLVLVLTGGTAYGVNWACEVGLAEYGCILTCFKMAAYAALQTATWGLNSRTFSVYLLPLFIGILIYSAIGFPLAMQYGFLYDEPLCDKMGAHRCLLVFTLLLQYVVVCLMAACSHNE
ncbi:hypothetical protein PMAYCL1PPCAC_25668, partial [Pristionchus mayeri]